MKSGILVDDNDDVIIIDNELKHLLPRLTDEEYMFLEKDIIENGCRMHLVYWDNNGKRILLGGHNRFAICKQHRIGFKAVAAPEVRSRVDAKIWIIKNQLGQRNLEPIIRVKLALNLKDRYAEKAVKNRAHGLTGPGKTLHQNSDKAFFSIDTNKKLAQIAGVSHDTMARADCIYKNASEDQKERLESGKASINEIYNEVKQKKKPQDNIEMFIKRFKWAVKREIIPVGMKLLDFCNDLSDEQRHDISNVLLETEKLLSQMSVEIRGSKKTN